MNSRHWQDVLDRYKQLGAEAAYPETKAIYARMEMLARSRLEAAEAIEKAKAKR